MQIRTLARTRRASFRVIATAIAAAAFLVPGSPATGAPAVTSNTADTVDEIHASFGDSPGTSMWLGWRGTAAAVAYGTSTAYDHLATPAANPIQPVDIAGPFQHVLLTGLTAGTVYHYSIDGGPDHQFETAPAGDFTWDDIGDTSTTYVAGNGTGCNDYWMSTVWAQVAAELPDFVSHGGDISYANECGVGAVHQLFQDIEPIATQRAWEQSWGNHEYGAPPSTAPPGTPTDSMANYKGRLYLANPQTSPSDTATMTSAPGCPTPGKAGGNGCLGSDWGYFQVGHVLIMESPEPWPNARSAWLPKADALMAAAEVDPNIYFIVTTGHRPGYTGQKSQLDSSMTTVENALADKYSPTARPDGKYVMNIAHHVHGGEFIAPQHGVLQVTNGGGGTEEVSWGQPAAGELFRTDHFEHLHITVSGTAMRVDMICGPPWPLSTRPMPCTAGSTLYSMTVHGYESGSTPPPPPPPSGKQWVANQGLDGGSQTGWTGIYNSTSRVGTSQGADGNWRLQLSTTATTAGAAGVNNPSPYWVNNASTADTTYTATAQAQPSVANEQVYILLRETTPSGTLVGSKAGAVTTLTDITTLTQLPNVSYTAHASGNSIRYSLIVNNLAKPQLLYADNFSLTSPT